MFPLGCKWPPVCCYLECNNYVSKTPTISFLVCFDKWPSLHVLTNSYYNSWLPWEPTTFIFRGYKPDSSGFKTFMFPWVLRVWGAHGTTKIPRFSHEFVSLHPSPLVSEEPFFRGHASCLQQIHLCTCHCLICLAWIWEHLDTSTKNTPPSKAPRHAAQLELKKTTAIPSFTVTFWLITPKKNHLRPLKITTWRTWSLLATWAVTFAVYTGDYYTTQLTGWS